MNTLNDKTALICGATSGIGLAIAKNYIAHGAKVIITGRRESGEDTASEIGAQFIRCDVTVESDVETCFKEAEQRLGKLDVLVINAGIADDEGSIEEFSGEGMNAIVAVNLNGVFYALKYGPRHMNDGGSIINTGSVAGSGITHAGTGVYAATKAAGAYLARTAAIENAPRGIRVNSVCPAMIAGTGMMVDDDGSDDAKFLGTLTAFGRMGRQDEVVGAYNFLASDASTFITGQEIRVDGGVSAGFSLPVFEAMSS
jgi:NAD(P)-dependent dehydrogenase (short-subunit alcohol dehydrogenase family)